MHVQTYQLMRKFAGCTVEFRNIFIYFFSHFLSFDTLQKRTKCYILRPQILIHNWYNTKSNLYSFIFNGITKVFIHSFICDHCNCTTMITDYFATTVISSWDFLVHACTAFARHRETHIRLWQSQRNYNAFRCKIAVQSTKWL